MDKETKELIACLGIIGGLAYLYPNESKAVLNAMSAHAEQKEYDKNTIDITPNPPKYTRLYRQIKSQFRKFPKFLNSLKMK